MVIVRKGFSVYRQRLMSVRTKAVGVAVLPEIQVLVLVSDDGMPHFFCFTHQLFDGDCFHIEMLHGSQRNGNACHAANERAPDACRANDVLRANFFLARQDSLNAPVLYLNASNWSVSIEAGASFLGHLRQSFADGGGFHIAITGNIKGPKEIIRAHDRDHALDLLGTNQVGLQSPGFGIS